MSALGLKAARGISVAAPALAAQLAAELRNAVTPASLAADQMDDEELGNDVAESVAHVLDLANALQGVGE